MAGQETKLPPSKISASFEVLPPSNPVHPPGYPLLIFGPLQYGNGVRIEDRGILISAIVAKSSEISDRDQLAAHFGTTTDHIHQAIEYSQKYGN